MRESDKITRNHHIPESQEVSPFPAGVSRLQGTDKRKHETQITKKGPQKKHPHGTVLTRRLFYGTNLTLISDVDQDK